MAEFITPSAYVDAHRISERSREKLNALARYDLSAITNQLVDRGRYFSPEQIWPLRDYFGRVDTEIAELLEMEFKRFVSLTILEPNHIYAPPGALDMYWHFFVLHTRDYARFCAEVWGNAHDHGALPKDLDDVRSLAPLPLLPRGDNRDLMHDITLVPKNVLLSLTPEVVQRIYLLEHWDLSFFTDRFVNNERRFSPEQLWPIIAHFGTANEGVAKTLELEFKKLIALTLTYQSEMFVPSGPVDMYWHFFLLHTKEYREFSNAMWGRFCHYPLNRSAEYGTAAGFAETIARYKEVFGETDPLVWHSPEVEIA